MADEKKPLDETPKKMPPVKAAPPASASSPGRETPLKSAFVPKESGMDVEEKDKPPFSFSLLHDNHVILTWLLNRINALDDAEEIRFSLLVAAEKSGDERLHKVVDELKAYIKAREQ